MSLLIIILFNFYSYGQTYWSKTYDSGYKDEICCAAKTGDKNYIIAGNSLICNEECRNHPWIIKINQNGDILWEKRFANEEEWVQSIAVLPNDRYIVAGTTWDDKHWLAKLDKNGNILFKKQYGNYYRFKIPKSLVLSLSDGNILFIRNDGRIFKLNSRGNAIWKKEFFLGAHYDLDVQAAIEFNNGYLIAGEYGVGQRTFSFQPAVYFFDKEGNLKWQKDYNTEISECYNPLDRINLIPMKDSRVLLTARSFDYDTSTFCHLLLKINKEGTPVWGKKIEASVITGFADENDNIILLLPYGLLKLNNMAIPILMKDYVGIQTYGLKWIIPDNDGYLIGGINSPLGSNFEDFWILKTDFNGNISDSCTFIYDGVFPLIEDIAFYEGNQYRWIKKSYVKPEEVKADAINTVSKPLTQCQKEMPPILNPTFKIECIPYTIPYLLRIGKCKLTSKEHFKGVVNLSCLDLPKGAYCSFSPSNIFLSDNGVGTTTLTIKLDSQIKEGIYPFTVIAKSGLIEKKFYMMLEILKK